MFFRYRQWAHIGNDSSTTLMCLSNLLGKFLKVRISFPNTDRITYATFSVDDKELCIFSMF